MDLSIGKAWLYRLLIEELTNEEFNPLSFMDTRLGIRPISLWTGCRGSSHAHRCSFFDGHTPSHADSYSNIHIYTSSHSDNGPSSA